MIREIASFMIFPILITLFASVYFSIKARRTEDNHSRGVNSARTNISMGSMLVFIALHQLFFYQEEYLRTIVGAIFLLIGLFNLFAGIRNLQFYRSRK